jgi:hypothetical protein
MTEPLWEQTYHILVNGRPRIARLAARPLGDGRAVAYGEVMLADEPSVTFRMDFFEAAVEEVQPLSPCHLLESALRDLAMHAIAASPTVNSIAFESFLMLRKQVYSRPSLTATHSVPASVVGGNGCARVGDLSCLDDAAVDMALRRMERRLRFEQWLDENGRR